MRILLYESITGGWLAREPLPESLAREGDLMAGALARDLADVEGVELIASRDPRLDSLRGCAWTLRPFPAQDPLAAYRHMLRECDAAWPVAPETGGVLEALSRATLEAGRILLTSRPEAVAVAASKRMTAAVLNLAGVPAVQACGHRDVLPEAPGPWVVKPDDGAGCEHTLRVPDRAAAIARLESAPDLVAQPWVEGDALSLSALFAEGRAQLLTVNRQRIAVRDGRVALAGLTVNAVRDGDGRFARLASAVAAALPGLWGYAGIDLIDTPSGPRIVEVNPRLTTSYCALHQATGLNVAALVLALLETGELPDVAFDGGREVSFALESADAA